MAELGPARVRMAAPPQFNVRMILSENRFPSRIKSGTGFFGIMR